MTEHLSPEATLAALMADHSLPLDTPAAQRAFALGLLEARRAALRTTERLRAIGRPLLIAVLGVSFVHIFDTIAAIRPPSIAPLDLPSWLYHATAAALTLAIDAAALFTIACMSTIAHAGRQRPWSWELAFFLITTFLLNAAFVIAYAPSLPASIRMTTLPLLELSFAVLIPATIPIALLAIERAQGELSATKLYLLVAITAMEALQDSHTPSPQNAAAGILRASALRDTSLTSHDFSPEAISNHAERLDHSEPLITDVPTVGGRPSLFTVEDIPQLAGANGMVFRSTLLEHWGCSAATADRLLSQALDAGTLKRIGRGAYQVLSPLAGAD